MMVYKMHFEWPVTLSYTDVNSSYILSLPASQKIISLTFTTSALFSAGIFTLSFYKGPVKYEIFCTKSTKTAWFI